MFHNDLLLMIEFVVRNDWEYRPNDWNSTFALKGSAYHHLRTYFTADWKVVWFSSSYRSWHRPVWRMRNFCLKWWEFCHGFKDVIAKTASRYWISTSKTSRSSLLSFWVRPTKNVIRRFTRIEAAEFYRWTTTCDFWTSSDYNKSFICVKFRRNLRSRCKVINNWSYAKSVTWQKELYDNVHMDTHIEKYWHVFTTII